MVNSATSRPDQNYGSGPCYGELIAILALGAGHIAAEWTISTAAARLFNVAAVIGFLGYILWRGLRTRNIISIWGLQRATFWPALRLQLAFGLPAMGILIAWGLVSGNRMPPPSTFWLAVALYPVWGIAQQFALQNLLQRNLPAMVRPPLARALLAAILFGLAHVPLMPIVMLTFVAGFFLTWIYQQRPNVWAAGAVHGSLGAMAFYFVLGRDPGARLGEFLSRLVSH